MIDDPGKDFFVEDNEVIERSALPLEYSDDYWERRYSIKPDQIPAFLHAHADKILRTGKYLNVIQQCNGDAKPKYTAGGTSTATNRAVLQQPENSHEYSAMDTSVTQAISDGKPYKKFLVRTCNIIKLHSINAGKVSSSRGRYEGLRISLFDFQNDCQSLTEI